MAAKGGKTAQILDELSALLGRDEPPEAAYVARFLGHRNNAIVAAAAACAGKHGVRELIGPHLTAYERFLDNAVKSDKGCMAKKALAKALDRLDYESAEWFVAGASYTQFEPAYGGAVDTAVDLRCTCLRALTRFPWFRASRPLVLRFGDEAPKVRMTALDTVASFGGREAELLLTAKLACGDRSEEVMGVCFRALLSLDVDANLDLVAGFLDHRPEEVAVEAALAIGESRAKKGFDLLHTAWESSPSTQMRRSLLLAISTLRSRKAEDLLRSLRDHPHYGDICRAVLPRD